MFADACELARGFTKPLIISTRQLDGTVKSACSAYIVLNKTAAHVFGSHIAFEQHKPLVTKYQAVVAEIEADGTLNPKQREKKLRRVTSNP